jgi:hypothetical protein
MIKTDGEEYMGKPILQLVIVSPFKRVVPFLLRRSASFEARHGAVFTFFGDVAAELLGE